jgi:hypothetical protein
MLKRELAICGIILFLGGIGLLYYIQSSIINGAEKAYALDHTPLPPLPAPCPYALLDVNVANRVMSEDDTQALTVVVQNNCPGKELTVAVTLNAPEFNFSPNESIRTITIPTSEDSIRFNWILIPIKIGTFAVSLSTNQYETVTVGITVTNTFGLSLWQTQLLSYIGTFFGPALTFAWWYDRWKERKQRKIDEAASSSVTTESPKPKPMVTPKSKQPNRRKH